MFCERDPEQIIDELWAEVDLLQAKVDEQQREIEELEYENARLADELFCFWNGVVRS